MYDAVTTSRCHIPVVLPRDAPPDEDRINKPRVYDGDIGRKRTKTRARTSLSLSFLFHFSSRSSRDEETSRKLVKARPCGHLARLIPSASPVLRSLKVISFCRSTGDGVAIAFTAMQSSIHRRADERKPLTLLYASEEAAGKRYL